MYLFDFLKFFLSKSYKLKKYILKVLFLCVCVYHQK